MSEDSISLGEVYPKEQARLRMLIQRYRDPDLMGAGELAARLIENDLREADKAAMSGDLSAMIVAYKSMQSWS